MVARTGHRWGLDTPTNCGPRNDAGSAGTLVGTNVLHVEREGSMCTVIHMPKAFGPIQDRRGYFDPREQAVDQEFAMLYGPCPACADQTGYTCDGCGFYPERCLCLPKVEDARKPVHVRLLQASLQPDAQGNPLGYCAGCGLPMVMHHDVLGIVWLGCEGATARQFMGLYENRPVKS